MLNAYKNFVIILLILAGLFFYKDFNKPKYTEQDYLRVNPLLDPIQDDEVEVKPFLLMKNSNEFTVIPVAKYKISAMLMSKKRYSLGWDGELVPFDLALAWGELIKPENDKYITYSQSGRWYFYRYSAQSTFDRTYISAHSANNHILPANENILKAIEFVSNKQIITLEGFLVNIKGNVKGKEVSWNTSTTRQDTGDGSCEVFYVNKVRIDNNVYT